MRMMVLALKWILLIVLVTLVILYFAGRKSVHTEIMIQASAEEVWSVLTDVAKIREWNPVLIPVEGEIKEGSEIQYEFHQDDSNMYMIKARVERVTAVKLLNQTGGMPGFLTFDHKYVLESSNGATKVIIHEDYRGIAVPFWNPASVEKAYDRLGEALRDRIAQLKTKR